MKKVLLLLLSLLVLEFVNAQQKAVTENGDEVILNEDGSWEYEDDDLNIETEIKTNPKKLKKDSKSTFLVKSSKLDVGVWIDPKVWNFTKSTENADAEYELQMKDGDLYGMIISEKVEIPLETLRTIALENGKSAAPDLKIVKEEYRTVNGLDVLLLQMDGTMQGIKFSYYGYYFSSENGSVQFITYTAQNLLEDYKSECEKLLNGLTEI